METLCNPETGECAVSYDTTSEDMTLLEDKVVAVIGCMVALLNRGREDVLSGRSSFANSFQIADVNFVDGKLPPLAIFRSEMKRCCESLQVALSSYLPPFEDRNISIWRRLQRLKNVCYDAGFSRVDAYPCPTLFANWGPVYFSSKKQETALGDLEVAFWRGGQVTDEGLNWLIEKGFKTIVDIREEAVKDEYYRRAVEQAVSCEKIEVLNLPVEVGVAPSMEQVENFASLVSDPNRRPLYLQSQEGVNRPSAMVSRWRQFITRSSRRSISNGPLSSDGKPSNVDKGAEQPSLQNLISLEPKGGILLDEEVDSTPKLDSTNDLRKTCKQQGSSVENGHYNGKVAHELAVDSTSSHGAAGSQVESLANFSLESNPLKAQFPTCDFFSRKEMRIFFKSKTVSPKPYVRPLRKKFEMLPNSCSNQSLPVQNNETMDTQFSERILQESSNEVSSVRQVISRTDAATVSDGKHLDSRSSAAFEASVNGFHQMKSCTITIEPNDLYTETHSPSKQALSSSMAKNKRTNDKFSTGSVKDLDVVEGDMCASATGVVRVQSRKKAEMFLVRTDGFSCTREKVTESSLAFTHPSTQQQMLMWKSPPKTVLLLKKLGEELMEEAKEVQCQVCHLIHIIVGFVALAIGTHWYCNIIPLIMKT